MKPSSEAVSPLRRRMIEAGDCAAWLREPLR